MTTQDFRPEVEERLRQLDPSVHQPDAEPLDNVINAYLAGGSNSETRELARRVYAEHREFFDLIGDR
ncbi:hypothetical protein ACQPZX_49605 [Actinoplanes sp. CA-142083]|uniref:hypothetical protein n=1 Tax=Actinoplanes sp. CA-142083 TaxID=3239903 RepID=UPI003D93F946